MKWEVFLLCHFWASISTVYGQCDERLKYPYPIRNVRNIGLPGSAVESEKYKNNLHCEWEMGDYKALLIEFQMFDLQQSQNCSADYLEIYTGQGDEENLVDRWCGTQYPAYVVLYHGRIIFHSDDSVAAQGFNLLIKLTTITKFTEVQFPVTATEKPQLFYAPFYGEERTRERTYSYNLKVTNPDNTKLVQFHYSTPDYSYFNPVKYHVAPVQVFESNSSGNSLDILGHCCGYIQEVNVSAALQLRVLIQTTAESHFPRFRLTISLVDKYESVCDGDVRILPVSATEYPKFLIVRPQPRWMAPASTEEAHCRWQVTTDLEDHDILLEVLEKKCQAVTTDLYNGGDNSSEKIASVCYPGLDYVRVRQIFVSAHFIKGRVGNSAVTELLLKIVARKRCQNGLLPLVASGGRSYTVMEYDSSPGCIWRIRSEDPEARLMVVGMTATNPTTDDNFQENCSEDSLLVYTDSTVSTGRLRAICPFLNQKGYRVFNDSLYLPTYTADNTRTKKVVPLYYYASRGVCDQDGPVILNASLEHKTLYSPNYPQDFWPQENCTYLMKAFASHYLLAFRIVKFEVKNATQELCSKQITHIEFYDGLSSSSNLLSIRCPGLQTDWIQAKSGHLFAKFQSAGDARGLFEIQYKAVRNDSLCNKQIQTSTTTELLSTPGFPAEMTRYECYYEFTAAFPTYVINMTVVKMDFNHDCMNNYVEAYDGKGDQDRLLKKWCGTETFAILTTGKYLYLRYKVSTLIVNRGFLLSYASLMASKYPCSSHLTAFTSSSYLNSPGYPDRYMNNMDCEWLIKADSVTSRVKLVVQDSSLEYDCQFDNVSIYDGVDKSAALLSTFCGITMPTFQSSSRYLLVVFHSDASRTRRGFKMKYYQTTDQPVDDVCNKYLTAFSTFQILESPGYPNSYASNLDCWWIVRTNNQAEKIKVEILHSSIEFSSTCWKDFVEFRDGNARGNQLGVTCGTSTPSFLSTSPSMYIHFKTDGSNNDKGFRLRYYTTKVCIAGHVTELTARVYADYIESPNYPDEYPSNSQCAWRIRTNTSRGILLTVMSSNIEYSSDCRDDYMTAFDGPGVISPLLSRWCGSQKPIITSTGQVMFVTFHSDGSRNSGGFKIKYTEVDTNLGVAPNSSVISVGMIVGVVSAVLVVAVVMLVIIFIIVRQRRKNQANAQLQRNRSGRRSSGRHSRIPNRSPWDINPVFYSQDSAFVFSPPPYSVAVNTPLPQEPPPPYPAAEFVHIPPKEYEEEAPPYAEYESGVRVEQSLEIRPSSSTAPGNTPMLSQQDESHSVSVPRDSNSVQNSCDNSYQAGDQVESAASPSVSDTKSLSDTRQRRPRPTPRSGKARPSHQNRPRPAPRGQGRSSETGQDQTSERGRRQRQNQSVFSRAVSVDNLVTGSRGLTNPVNPQNRASSLSNLVWDPQNQRDYDQQKSLSEKADYEQRPAAGSENFKDAARPVAKKRNMHRESDWGGDRSTNSDRSRSPNSMYARNPRDGHHRPRDRRHNRFTELKQRSRSHDNLAADRLSVSPEHNPRWSVASESYMDGGRRYERDTFTNPRWSSAGEVLNSSHPAMNDRSSPIRARISDISDSSQINWSGQNLTLQEDPEEEARLGGPTETAV